MFIALTKKEIRQRRLETIKIAKMLDDVDWMYGPKSRIKRHERSEWIQKVLLDGVVCPVGGMRVPEWLAKQLEALPPNCNATLCFNLCESLPENAGEQVVGVDRADPALLPEVTFDDILKEFGERELGVEFSDLVRYYIKTKFDNVQSLAAKAAQLDPQVVNQIYNAKLNARHQGKVRGVTQRTVIALGLAFELTLDEAEEFMRSAGFAFSDSDDDRLIKLCFKRRFYKISKINTVLQALQKDKIGSKPRCE